MATKNVSDNEAVAPDFFSISVESCGQSEAQEWMLKARAFVDAMSELDRAVLLKWHPDEGVLYLSSVPESK